jgi:hypothetical protein
VWALLWVVGHVAGGAVLGAALGWAGALLSAGGQAIALALLGAGCLAGGLHQLGVIRLPMPQVPRQVPRHWLGRLPWSVVALGYGVQLGCGAATRIKVATTYAAFGFALLSGSAAAGALLLGLFGLARSLLPVVLGPGMASPTRSLGFAVDFDAHEKWVGKLNGVALLLTAALLAFWVWSSAGA